MKKTIAIAVIIATTSTSVKYFVTGLELAVMPVSKGISCGLTTNNKIL